MGGDEGIDPTRGVLTPYRELDAVLVDHAEALRAALGDDLVGLYPLGSLAIGDFDLTSDVDLALVVQQELTQRQVGLVQSVHTTVIARDSRWVRHLEYSVFPMPLLARKSSPYGPDGRNDSPDRRLWYFQNGAAAMERSDHDNTLVTRWTLRNRSRAVLGQDPAEVAPEVSADELRVEIRASMLGWKGLLAPGSQFDNRFHQVFFVLNGCRALQDLHEGRITSKREGVGWAKRHLDPRWHGLIDAAWREREDTGISVTQPADRDAVLRTVEFVDHTTELAERFRVRSTSAPARSDEPLREEAAGGRDDRLP